MRGFSKSCALISPLSAVSFGLSGISGDSPQLAFLEVDEDLARRVVPRRTRHAAAGMRAGATHIYAWQRAAIVTVPEHRARREDLIQVQRAVEDVAADQAERSLEVERAVDLPSEHRGFEVRRVLVDRLDHQIRDGFAMRIPRLPIRQLRRDVLAEHARDVLARRRET